MPGDSGALIVAGWPNNTDNFDQLVNDMIHVMSSSEEREFIPHHPLFPLLHPQIHQDFQNPILILYLLQLIS